MQTEGPPLAAMEACGPPLAAGPLSKAQAEELAGMFKALADPVRLRLLSLIASHPGGEACVCEVAGAFELTGPTISHHLKVLREAGWVEAGPCGRFTCYRLWPGALEAAAAYLGDLAATARATCASNRRRPC